jgi:hypothetical protein
MKLSVVLTLFTVIAFFSALPANAAEYEIDAPEGWQVNNFESGDMILQAIDPRSNAVVEVYRAKSGDPDIKNLADNWEDRARKAGIEHVQTRKSDAAVTLQNGTPAIMREYYGLMNKMVINSVIIFTHKNGYSYVVVGIYFDALKKDYEDLVYPAVKSFRFNKSASFTGILGNSLGSPANQKLK